MDDQYGIFDFISIGKQRHIHERKSIRQIPALVGIQGTRMIAALRLVISVVILDELRGIGRQRVDDTARPLVRARAVVLGALSIECPAVAMRSFLMVSASLS